jgi:hypothetical protein
MTSYSRFLETKGLKAATAGLTEIPQLSPHLKPFQAAIVQWALRKGRAALFEGLVADRLERNAILIELNPEYIAMAERRIRDDAGMFAEIIAEPQPSLPEASLL